MPMNQQVNRKVVLLAIICNNPVYDCYLNNSGLCGLENLFHTKKYFYQGTFQLPIDLQVGLVTSVFYVQKYLKERKLAIILFGTMVPSLSEASVVILSNTH